MDARDYSGPVLQELLGADAVLPEQFWKAHEGSTHRSGERALMWAVFADGIESYRRTAHATSAERRLEFLEAESWILGTDWEWPFSFVNLCEAFGFNPAGVRWSLVHWRSERTHEPFHRQRFRPVALRAA